MQGSHKLWKYWKTWKITKKSSMHGKIMEFEKNLNNHEKIMDFFLNILVKPPVARKLAVRHTKLVCLTASFLATGGFTKLFQNACMVYKHDYLNTLLLLHSSYLY